MRVILNRPWHSSRLRAVAAALVIVLLNLPLLADSVVPVAVSIRPGSLTVTLMNPGGGSGSAGSDTVLRPGDILTFVIRSTHAPNGTTRGVNGYLTAYIPDNTEVVAVRFIDADGNTVLPRRAGLASDGVGPRGPRAYSSPLANGSLAQLYAGSGIFFSTDPRTARQPVPSASSPFITLKNGLQMSNPSGAAQLDQLLGTSAPYFAHSEWDLTQVLAFGVAGTVTGATGNTPEHVASSGFGYGSPVAGPQTWYKLEATIDPPGSAITTANAKFLGSVGPWQRIRLTGAETGMRGAGPSPPAPAQVMPNPGLPLRVGGLAVDGSGNPQGWDLSADNPLPSISPRTNSVRFALGELAVGSSSFAELSLRVKQLPLESQSMMDAVCVEFFAGDASSRDQTGAAGGKDNPWRYFVPNPACVTLNVPVTNSVSKVLAVSGDTLTYSITANNLSTQAQQNVVVRDCFHPGNQTFVSATAGFVLDAFAGGCPDAATQDAVVWNVGTLLSGASLNFTVNMTAQSSTTNAAVYTSQSLPAPGFATSAYTNVFAASAIRLALEASPSHIPTLPGTVRYTARVQNEGTGAVSNACLGGACYVEVNLPAGFSYQPGSSTINGAAAANPTVTGQSVRYLAGQLPSIPAGGMLTIEFNATIAGGTPAGLYTADLQTWLRSSFLQDIEDSVVRQAPVTVISPRSDTPILSTPIGQGSNSVGGTTTEGGGSTVRVFVNGNPAGSAFSSAGGSFSVSLPRLFAGQRVTATIQASGELESLASAPVEVSSSRVFTDDSLVPGSTVIKAVHLVEVRDSVNALRTRASLMPVAWTDVAASGLTIKAVHIIELRNALTPALTALGRTATYTDPSLTSGNVVKAIHIQEIREYTR